MYELRVFDMFGVCILLEERRDLFLCVGDESELLTLKLLELTKGFTLTKLKVFILPENIDRILMEIN